MKMKVMKRFSSILLALVMMLAMVMTVSATRPTEGADTPTQPEGEGTPTTTTQGTSENTRGSITINNTIEGQTYAIYRIFDLESFNSDNKAYSYKVAEKWQAFFATTEAQAYAKANEDGYVSWVGENTDSRAAELAQLALQYAKENGIAADGTEVAGGETVAFSDLPLGYYLVDSTVGTLCVLTTTNPTQNIEDKNEGPSIEKEVEDTKGEAPSWGESNTANIGETVNFRATISVPKSGAEGYVMHDKMSSGLTFVNDSVKVELNGTEVDAAYYNYQVVAPGSEADDPCTFEVVFSQDFCDSLKADDKIVITYSAVLNKDAVIAGNGNTNDVQLKYGENHDIDGGSDQTKTYTYEFGLVKVDGDKELLTGAEFELYTTAEGGEAIKLVKEGDTYRLATAEDAEDTTTTTIEAGNVTIKGLGNGTYWLEETKAPDGYNKLSERQSFTIADKSDEVSMNGDIYGQGGLAVMNQTGTELPSTGGIGTTIFYVVGGILVVGAVVLLVVKKRMSHQA